MHRLKLSSFRPRRSKRRINEQSGNLLGTLANVFVSVASGAIGGVLSSILILGWEERGETSVTLESVERSQGAASLKWSFNLRPERRFWFSMPRESGVSLHVETPPNDKGEIGVFDWREFDRFSFQAKSSVEGLALTEVNVFVGPHRAQYVFNDTEALRLSTKWRTIEIPLQRFRLADWELQENAASGRLISVKNLSKITAMGFDIKTDADELRGTVLIDAMDLIKKNGRKVRFSDADEIIFSFDKHSFVWFARSQVY